jgi:hypothetical protein
MTAAHLSEFLPVLGKRYHAPLPNTHGLERAAPAPVDADLLEPIEMPARTGQMPVSLERHELDAAFARGIEAGRREAQNLAAAARQEQKEIFEADLAAARAEWAALAGSTLASELDRAMTQLRVTLEASVARVLTPIIGEAARSKALEALRDVIARAVESGESPIAVTGPADLIGAIEVAFSRQHPGISYAVEDDDEVTVRFDKTVIETRVGEWERQLREIAPWR